MCGIAGFLTNNNLAFEKVLKDMGNAISSRGPDSSGEWFDNKNCIGLAHRRLSILDLSKEGNHAVIDPFTNFGTTIDANIGDMENKGVEIQLNSTLFES